MRAPRRWLAGALIGMALCGGLAWVLDARPAAIALAHSLGGAAAGYGALWAVVELGKLAFGRKRIAFEKAEPFTWTRRGDEADFVFGEDRMLWSEFFARGNERLTMRCPEIEIDGRRFENAELVFRLDAVECAGRRFALPQTDLIRGTVREAVLPREAMGFGDVKLIACIGAFLGWKAVVFTIFSGATIGALIGVLTVLVGRREWSAKIPFGPYLAVGALLWLFHGPEWVAQYLRYARG
jgi:leader peptidase (prepilin peptidase)/N-methyltransferase